MKLCYLLKGCYVINFNMEHFPFKTNRYVGQL